MLTFYPLARHRRNTPVRAVSALALLLSTYLVSPGLVQLLSPSVLAGQPEYKGRKVAQVMGAAGADWLMREDREKYEQPEKVLDALDIRRGMTIADVGAGNGYFTLRLARRVTSSGKVFAVDIQQPMLELLDERQKREGLTNIELVLGTPVDPKLPPATVDLALLVDVYHEFQRPEEMVTGIRAALKPAGVMVLVEYRGEDASVPIKPEHKMTVAQVLGEIEPMGFRLRKKLDFLPWQHIFIFEKAD
ncbi:MAG: class I SAM-dependent methyltransferase [Acidimicrobiia bacterium]|nr:class I SAM-dependent methyltransferase [Acidimicrobiia bacterium]